MSYKTELAICVVGLMSIVGLLTGHDGVLLTSAIAVVAALGGYTFARSRKTPS